MQIKKLYEKYNLMPGLILHQLRVAGVVKLITDDKESIITALVHDMGNLAKFGNLDSYWSMEQAKFWDIYGKDAHDATIKILDESGLSVYKNNILEENNFYTEIMNISNFSKSKLPVALTFYADSRVSLEGVVSMTERAEDLEKRYQHGRSDHIWGPKLESYVQTLTKINVRQISEADVTPLFDELLNIQI